MKKCRVCISYLLVFFASVSCVSGIDETKTLDECPVVGSVVQVGENAVVACDQKLLKDTILMPLSSLAEELEIIRLDSKEDALVSEGDVQVTDNYILVRGNKQTPFKLFDKKGNFLTTIGAFGQGPGEYTQVYNYRINEQANRIYLLQWQINKLLAYDLQGNSLTDIPLSIKTPKASFMVNEADSTVAVVVLPFPGLPAVAWSQDFNGNPKNHIEPGHLAVPHDFSNEVMSGNNTSEFDVNIMCIMPTRVDSLYHYDYKNNKMRPCFTMKLIQDPAPWHMYSELPRHFIGNASLPVQVAPGMFESSAPIHYVVDKQTLKGSYCKFINDYLDNEEIWPAFSNGYYVRNVDPNNFKEQLENSLKKENLTPEMKTKLQDLKNSILENDNNYILVARLKK